MAVEKGAIRVSTRNEMQELSKIIDGAVEAASPRYCRPTPEVRRPRPWTSAWLSAKHPGHPPAPEPAVVEEDADRLRTF